MISPGDFEEVYYIHLGCASNLLCVLCVYLLYCHTHFRIYI